MNALSYLAAHCEWRNFRTFLEMEDGSVKNKTKNTFQSQDNSNNSLEATTKQHLSNS